MTIFWTRELLWRKVTGVGVSLTHPATAVTSPSPPSPELIVKNLSALDIAATKTWMITQNIMRMMVAKLIMNII